MADQFSFDVVSEVNMQELKNALDQATKEIKQRFDFKDSKTEITLKEKEKELVVVSDDEYKLNAVQDIIKTKCVKRGVSLKAEPGPAVRVLGPPIQCRGVQAPPESVHHIGFKQDPRIESFGTFNSFASTWPAGCTPFVAENTDTSGAAGTGSGAAVATNRGQTIRSAAGAVCLSPKGDSF